MPTGRRRTTSVGGSAAIGALAALGLGACAGPAPRPITIPAVILAPAAIAAQVRAGLATPRDGITVAPAELPESTGRVDADGEPTAAVAAARRAYIGADFPACRAALDPIDPLTLMNAHRAAAARVLVWRVACAVGAGDLAAARRDAAALATARLELPADITAVTPDVEALIGDAQRTLAAAPGVGVRVTAAPAGAQIAVDGRDAACGAPCTVMMTPGAHLVAVTADGFAPAVRRVEAPAERAVAVELVEAAPPVVAAQLQVRVGRGAPVDEPGTLALAARAVRARKVVVLGLAGARLVGALYADGRIGARGERRLAPGGSATAPAGDLVRELLATGGVTSPPPLWRRPRFWLSVAIASALTAGITAYIVFRPDPRTQVVFP